MADSKNDIELLLQLAKRLGIKAIEEENDEIFDIMQDSQFKVEIAVLLYQNMKATLAKASEFAGLHQFEFQKILAERKIPIHYDVKDLENDLSILSQVNDGNNQ